MSDFGGRAMVIGDGGGGYFCVVVFGTIII